MEFKRKPKTSIVVLVILNILFGVLETEAQKDLSYYLPDVQNLNSEITTPEEFFGFQIGEQHVSHTQQMYYLKNLAQESDRIQFHIMGRTHEERPIIYLYISDSENINKLDEIQKQHLNGSDSKSENENNPDERPLIVWQGYSIHGNEVAAANAAMLVAYYLAASENPEIVNIFSAFIED